jgi:hypothetical protein
MYIIYTKLNAKQYVSTNTPSSTSNKIPIPSANPPNRVANSLKTTTNNTQSKDRATTSVLPIVKTNLVVPVRSNSVCSDQNIGNNIPPERNVDFFKSKLTDILTKATLSHRRESLWEKLIASRPDNPITGRQEVIIFSLYLF